MKSEAKQFENKGASVFAYLSSVLEDRKKLSEQITAADGSLAVGKKHVIQGLADFYPGASTIEAACKFKLIPCLRNDTE